MRERCASGSVLAWSLYFGAFLSQSRPPDRRSSSGFQEIVRTVYLPVEFLASCFLQSSPSEDRGRSSQGGCDRCSRTGSGIGRAARDRAGGPRVRRCVSDPLLPRRLGHPYRGPTSRSEKRRSSPSGYGRSVRQRPRAFGPSWPPGFFCTAAVLAHRETSLLSVRGKLPANLACPPSALAGNFLSQNLH